MARETLTLRDEAPKPLLGRTQPRGVRIYQRAARYILSFAWIIILGSVLAAHLRLEYAVCSLTGGQYRVLSFYGCYKETPAARPAHHGRS